MRRQLELFSSFDLDAYRYTPPPPKPPDQVQIRFTEGQWAACERASRERNESALSLGRRNSWENSSMTNYEKNAMGMAGEHAVALYLGTTPLADEGPGHQPDLNSGGITIEVKSTKYSPPHLKFRSEEEFGSAVAVMVLAARPRVCVLWGWVTREDFFKRARREDYGYGPRWALKPPYKPMRELKAWTQSLT